MRKLLLLMVVLLPACTGVDQQPPSPTYPRQTTRQSDPLNDINKNARSVRSIIGNIMGIQRDISR